MNKTSVTATPQRGERVTRVQMMRGNTHVAMTCECHVRANSVPELREEGGYIECDTCGKPAIHV
jgi:hypothetical protein